MRGSQAFRAWVGLWDQREVPASLAASRVLVGLTIFFDLAYAAFVGVSSAAWAPPPAGLGWGAVSEAPPLAARLFGAKSATAESLFWIALAASLLFALGACFRPAAFILVCTLSQLAHFAPSGDRGIDKLLRIVVIVLALSSAHRRWAVDAWIGRRWSGRLPPATAPAWPRYLLFAQITWVYFSAAHNRADFSWWPQGGFSAVASILADPHVARFTPGSLAWFYPLLQLSTAATMLFEISAPLLIPVTWLDRRPGRGGRVGDWVRRLRLRWCWLALGVSLHLGIALTMRLGIFPFGMLALYPLLLHPDELERVVTKARRQPCENARDVETDSGGRATKAAAASSGHDPR
jgi:hypothetical protein